MDFELQENQVYKGCQSMIWSFRLAIPSNQKWLPNQDYEILYSLRKGDSVVKLWRTFVREDSLFYLSSSDIQFAIPFSDLQLSEGKQALVLQVQGYNHTMQDSLHSEAWKLDTEARLAFEITMPAMQHLQLLMNCLELDTTQFNPSESDFRLFGSGFPDITWQISKADKPIFQSFVCTNTLDYCKTDTLPTLHICKEDLLTLTILDHDNVSKDDVLAETIVKASDLLASSSYPLVFSVVKGMQFVERKKRSSF